MTKSTHDFVPAAVRKAKQVHDFLPAELAKRDVGAKERKTLAQHGDALPGGGFPIKNAADLANAKRAIGRAKDPAAARALINRRAKELGERPLGKSLFKKAAVAAPEVEEVCLAVEVAKADAAGELKDGLVWGWASVIERGGKTVIDAQGDQISEGELLKAAHDYMQNSRIGGAMHIYKQDNPKEPLSAGHTVESVVFTKDLQKALGIDLGKVGWLIGVRLTDEHVRKAVASGVLKSFSIGGSGVREKVNGN